MSLDLPPESIRAHHEVREWSWIVGDGARKSEVAESLGSAPGRHGGSRTRKVADVQSAAVLVNLLIGERNGLSGKLVEQRAQLRALVPRLFARYMALR